jgi:putative transposase
MQVHFGAYYHVYNRSNAHEVVFRTEENYRYFLKKYRTMLETYIDTIAYCLIPTHFHALIRIKSEADGDIGAVVGKLLSSYTRAFNIAFQRHGSLFQQHTKAILIDNERYITAVLVYIHNNPVRAGLVSKPEEWKFSSFQDYCGLRDGTLPKKELVSQYFSTTEEFQRFSMQMNEAPVRYWV